MDSSAHDPELSLTGSDGETSTTTQVEGTLTKLWHAAAMAIGLSVLAPILLLTLLFAVIPAFVLILPFLLLELAPLERMVMQHVRHAGLPGHEPAWAHAHPH